MKRNQLQCLQTILDHADSRGLLDVALNTANSKGSTPLHCAWHKFQLEHVKMLIQKGADGFATTHRGKYLPSHNALLWLHRECVTQGNRTHHKTVHNCTDEDRTKCYEAMCDPTMQCAGPKPCANPEKHWRLLEHNGYDCARDEEKSLKTFSLFVEDELVLKCHQRHRIGSLVDFPCPEAKELEGGYFDRIHKLLAKLTTWSADATAAAEFGCEVIERIDTPLKYVLPAGFRAITVPGLGFPTLSELCAQRGMELCSKPWKNNSEKPYKSKQNFCLVPEYTLQRGNYKCKDETWSHLTCHVFWLEGPISQYRFLEVGRGVGAYKVDQKRSGEDEIQSLHNAIGDYDFQDEVDECEPAAKKPRHNADETAHAL